ncbi:MAG: helix-turn-helix transcriptional regulator, partial [Ruminococcus sp.]|nr:helix-turn-helix transcriptional regulator [Ruminococcus sp.]
ASKAASLKKHDLFFIAPNHKYRFVNTRDAKVEVIGLNLSNPASVTQEYLPSSIIKALASGNCTPFAVVEPKEQYFDKIHDCIDQISMAVDSKSEYFQLLVHGKMYEAYYHLFSNGMIKVFNTENKSRKYRIMNDITEYISEHYVENISLESVAEATGISRYYVSHLFKELMSTTFVNYVNEMRLNRAAMLLITTDNPVIEIAAMSGFNNLSNFNRAFKIRFDKTPTAYRKP